MRIGGVVSACNDNPEYYSYVPIFVKTWRLLFPTIQIRILFVTPTPERLPTPLRPFVDFLVTVPSSIVNSSNSVFLSQIVRILYPALWSALDPGLAILTTDIDMIPLNTAYYTKPIKALHDSSFVIFRPPSDNQVYICYTAASSSTWAQVTGISSWDDVARTCNEIAPNWYSDQQALYRFVMKSGLGERIHVLSDVSTGFRRLDRSGSWGSGSHSDMFRAVAQGFFSDYHMHRPYAHHAHLLHQVVDAVAQFSSSTDVSPSA